MKTELYLIKEWRERQQRETELVEQLFGVYPEDPLSEEVITRYVELLAKDNMSEETLSSFIYDFNFGSIEGFDVDGEPIDSIEDFCRVFGYD